MFRTFINQLETEKRIELALPDEDLDKIEMPYHEVFRVLKSPDYLRDVPRVSYQLYDLIIALICLVYELKRYLGQRAARPHKSCAAALRLHYP